ncbi:hypothetical protein D9M72_567050 [compost metagenome]
MGWSSASVGDALPITETSTPGVNPREARVRRRMSCTVPSGAINAGTPVVRARARSTEAEMVSRSAPPGRCCTVTPRVRAALSVPRMNRST